MSRSAVLHFLFSWLKERFVTPKRVPFSRNRVPANLPCVDTPRKANEVGIAEILDRRSASQICRASKKLIETIRRQSILDIIFDGQSIRSCAEDTRVRC